MAQLPAAQPSLPCPCGRVGPSKKPLAFGICCSPFVDDFEGTPAPDAESLMRSRYSAFVLERRDYLLATWHTSTRPGALEFDPGVKWLGLELRQHRQMNETHAEVEFVARQKGPGMAAVRLHERSRFVLAAGRWFYVDGDQL